MEENAMESLRYFYGAGMIENTYGDQRHYLEILLRFSADKLHVSLEQPQTLPLRSVGVQQLCCTHSATLRSDSLLRRMLYIPPQKLDRFGEHQLKGPIFLYFPIFWLKKSVTIACYLFIIIRYCRIFHFFAIPTAPIRSGTPFLHPDRVTNRPKWVIYTTFHHIFFYFHIQRVSVIPTKLFFLTNEIGAFDLQKKHETESIIYM